MATQLLAMLGAGVASFLAPCLVPLVPAYVATIVGEAGDSGRPADLVRATMLFVVGFASVFAALGAAAGLLGSSLESAEGTIQRVGGVVVALMGLALLGIVRGPLAQERRLVSRLPSGRWARPLVVGVAFGAAWSPCVGPLLGAALTVAAQSAEAGRGAVLLLAYALGIGVPFLVASLALASSPGLTRRLGRAGAVMQRAAGGLLVVLGALLLTGTYRYLTSYLARFTPAVPGF